MRRLSPGLLVGIGVAACVLATAASAADMPVPAAPAYYPPVYRPVIYDWTGIYVGGDVGGGWLHDVVTRTAAMANNILALKAAGATVIADDTQYFNEPWFQDGVIAQAIDTVTSAGVP